MSLSRSEGETRDYIAHVCKMTASGEYADLLKLRQQFLNPGARQIPEARQLAELEYLQDTLDKLHWEFWELTPQQFQEILESVDHQQLAAYPDLADRFNRMSLLKPIAEKQHHLAAQPGVDAEFFDWLLKLLMMAPGPSQAMLTNYLHNNEIPRDKRSQHRLTAQLLLKELPQDLERERRLIQTVSDQQNDSLTHDAASEAPKANDRKYFWVSFLIIYVVFRILVILSGN